MIKKNKKLGSILLLVTTLIAFLIFGSSPHDHFHPLLSLFSLLPLQFGALVWAHLNGHLNSFKMSTNIFE